MEAVGASLRKGSLFGIAFVALNILDARLTGVALALGSTELNPIITGFGDSMLLKGLASVTIAIAVLLFKREKLLKPLCLGMLLVVLWNSVAIWSWM